MIWVAIYLPEVSGTVINLVINLLLPGDLLPLHWLFRPAGCAYFGAYVVLHLELRRRLSADWAAHRGFRY